LFTHERGIPFSDPRDGLSITAEGQSCDYGDRDGTRLGPHRTRIGEQLASSWRVAEIGFLHDQLMAPLRVLDGPTLRRNPTDLRVHAVSSTDAGILAGIGARTFFDSYASDYPAEDIRSYIATSFTSQHIAAEISEAGTVFLLAYRGEEDHAAGYAKLRLAPPPPCVAPDAIELQRLYVERAEIGTGVGGTLLERCFEVARGEGHSSLWCGVDRGNTRAIGFYESRGFHIAGEHPFILGRVVCSDLVMEAPCT
jgi:ribosomal protein S18 acetylase RimI-like enzyme